MVLTVMEIGFPGGSKWYLHPKNSSFLIRLMAFIRREDTSDQLVK